MIWRKHVRIQQFHHNNLGIIKKLTLILCLLVSINVQSQTVVEQKIDSIGIFIGQQAHITIDVMTNKGAMIKFPDIESSHYLVPGIEIVDVSNADTSQLINNRIKVSKCITITSFNEKLYAIPGQKIKVDGKEYSGNILALKVVTIDVDTLHPNQFFPPKTVQNNPFLWKEWSLVFWLSIFVLILFVLAIYFAIRLKENKPIITKIRIVKRILPHQKALEAINHIKEEKLSSSDKQKVYYTQLTDTLRQYINERFGFNAMGMTSSEIIYHLKQCGNQKMIDELKSLFETADLVKFAKYETLINENDKNLVNAIHFIDETKQDDLPTEDKIVPKLDDKDKRTLQNRITIKALLWAISIAILSLIGYVAYHIYSLIM